MQTYDAKSIDLSSDAMKITTGKDGDIQLIDLRGKDYNDTLWSSFLDQLTLDEMVILSTEGGFGTAAIERLGIVSTVDNDGPAALKTKGLGTEATTEALTAYPSEVVIASTWNYDLVYELGVIIGTQSLACGTTGWYAPGANTHRSPFAGRNFEYYSEDGYLSGTMAAAQVSGGASKGMFAYIKHFALNDQESYRNRDSIGGWTGHEDQVMLMTWADEQTIREIYLKPFELCVKNAETEIQYISDDKGTISSKTVKASTAVMSSFNYIGNQWAGGDSSLLMTVLRDEWGFKGTVVTDACFYGYMDYAQMIRNGGDIPLKTFMVSNVGETSNPALQENLRRAVHNISYTKVMSNAVNGIKPGSTIRYSMAPWQIIYIVVDIVGGLIIIVCLIAIIKRKRKKIGTVNEK